MQFHLLLLYALLPLHAMTCKGSELNNGPFRCARLRGGGRYQGCASKVFSKEIGLSRAKKNQKATSKTHIPPSMI
eukprot:748082-Hanusia_phi.AAC.5